MKTFLAACLVLAVPSYGAPDSTADQAVIKTLKNLHKENHDEQMANAKEHAERQGFCESHQTQAERTIEKLESQIQTLQASIEKATADQSTAQDLSNEKTASKNAKSEDLGEHTQARNEEKEAYLATVQDYQESISALQRAIHTLKANTKTRGQTLIQILPIVPMEQRSVIESFLQQPNPQAHGYEGSSGGVINMLEELLKKFKTELFELEKGNIKNQAAFDMMKQDLSDQMTTLADAIANQNAAAQKARETKGQDTAALGDAQVSLKTIQDSLRNLVASCNKSARMFEATQANLKENEAALKDALVNLQSDAAQKAFMQLTPEEHKRIIGGMFLQMQSSASVPDEKLQRIAQFLQDQASRLKSRTLSLAALRSTTTNPNARAGVAGPLQKVVGMIRDMISKLKEEAGKDIAKYAMCQKSLKNNKQKRTSLNSDLEAQQSDIDGFNAKVQNLNEKMAEAQEAVADTNEMFKHATEDFEKNKARRENIIKVNEDALVPVKGAIKALKMAFGGESSERGEAMTMVIKMIQEVQSTMDKKIFEAKEDIADTTSDYERLDEDTKTKLAVLNADMDDLEASKLRTSKKLQSTRQQKADTNTEMSAAMDVYDSLKDDCISTGLSYEERVAKRDEEIQSLKEALKVLDSE